jgi:hypothetical protein
MAIQFLNSIDLNNIPAEGFAVENLATDPSVTQEGSIYYNTGIDKLKVRTGAGWIEVGSGVTDITAASGTYISFTDASAATGSVDLGTFNLSAVDGTSITATRFLSKDNTWDVPSYTTITTTDGTYIDLTPNTATGGAVTITADISAIDGTAGANERYLTKNNTWAEIATIPGTYTWTIAGNTGSEAVVSGDTITFAGGPNCSTSYATGTNTLTINSDNTTYDLSVPTATTAIRLAATGPSSDDDVTISGTANEVDITRIGAQELRVGLTDDVTITGELTVSGTGQSSFGGQVTVPTTPSAGTDAASKSYVDSLVAGGLTFKDGFNAGTGAIDGGGNLTTGVSRVAISIGDYYVVTTAGSFYGSVSLDVGDSIIAKQDAAQGTSDINDWVIVQGDEGVTTFSNSNGGTYVAYGTTNSGAIGAVNIGDVDLTAVDGTSDTATRFLSKDNTWDVPSYTTNTDAKYALTAATKSGSNIPLTLTGSDGGATTVVNLTEGSNITLTRNSSGQITIASTDTGALGDRVSLTGGSQASGLTTFTYDVTNSFTGASAIDVKCEVISSAGETVYASVTRSGANLSVEFVGSISDGAYEVLLTYVG